MSKRLKLGSEMMFFLFLALYSFAVLNLKTPQIGSTRTPASAKAPVQCKMQFNDIGTIVGRGKDQDAALEDAATKCFDLRSKAYRMKHGVGPSEDPGLLYIDTCVNTKCG